MSHEVSMKTLQRSGIREGLQHIKTLTSAVTTAWGVNWDEAYIARDLMQNFFDANRDRLSEVVVTQDGPTMSISAPTPFELERLFYLGSEKGEDDIGHYGEGFKVAATCLLRDHNVTPIARSGHEILCLRIAEETVGGTAQLRPIEYDFFRCDEDVPGTRLDLMGCSGRLSKAIREGMLHFFHEANPLLGSKLWSSGRADEFAVYASTTATGHIFYRNFKRGEIDDIPLVLVFNKQYALIEKKISRDRDRNAFGSEMLKMFYNHFARFALNGHFSGQKAVLELAKPCWSKGHSLLSEIADHASTSWTSTRFQKEITEVFGQGYFARSVSRDAQLQLQYAPFEKQWQKEGRIALPQYFTRFGVLNASSHIEEIRRKAAEESKSRNRRIPTRPETESLQILSSVTGEFAPEMMAIFRRRHTSYTVAETDTVLGELKTGRGYRSSEVYLAAKVFVADFSEALAVFLHEHAHIFGHDGDRGFTDALTELLEMLVSHRQELDRFDAQWQTARLAVSKERKKGKPSKDGSLDDWLATKDADELRDILKTLPPVTLRKLRGGPGD